MGLTDERVAEVTKNYAQVWMDIWEEESQAAVDRTLILFAPDGVYHSTTFSQSVGHDRIRVVQSMILMQQNGKGSTKYVGVAGGLGVFTWEIEYEVISKQEWSSRVPQEILNSPEWESFRAIPFASDKSTPIKQAGIATLEFNDDGLVTHFREYWFTKMLDKEA